jgi:hypothetical protein
VVSLTEPLWTEPLPASTSAQLAELIALTKALQLSEGKTATPTQTLSMPSWAYVPLQPFGKSEDC